MRKCKHFKTCSLHGDSDDENSMCILHSEDPNKNVKDFAKALSEHKGNRPHDFGYIVFVGEVHFENEVFSDYSWFNDCIFYEHVSFRSAVFKKKASFSGTNFHKYAIFDSVTFEDKVNFAGANFKNIANFIGTTFLERADFINSTFRVGFTFSGVKFFKGADFSQLDLHSSSSRFIQCYFSGNVLFRHGRQKGREPDIIRAFENAKMVEIIFCDINPSEPVIFRIADMSRVLFSETRLLNVEFTDVIWPTITDLFRFRRLAIYDEIYALERIKLEKDRDKIKDIKKNFIRIERMYRDLKTNYENDSDWIRGGDFHYAEKEMRRKNPDTNLILKFFLTLYWILSGYGERYLRPIFWTLIFLILCTAGYINFGIAPDGLKNHSLKISEIYDWLDAALYGLQVITLQRPIDLQPISLISKTIKALQGIFGPIFLGFLALAIRQKMKR
jgi:uncharacterized protein YjbI with pentapeptide repeats